MDSYQKIALNTQEKSLLELHEKIITLLAKQPEEVRSLIEQLVDYYQKIILCMPGNVYWLDKTCLTIGGNQKVLDMFGLKNLSEFEHLNFEEMAKLGSWTKGQHKNFEQDTKEVIETGQPKLNIEEPPIPTPQGHLIYFLSNRMPIFNAAGEIMGIVGISTDISKQKENELALLESNNVKSEFLANLNHDIRTPLASIVSLSETLANKITDNTLSELASNIQSCAEQLMILLGEILEVAEIGENKVKASEKVCNIRDLFNSGYSLMKTHANQKGLKIKYTVDPKIPKVLYGKHQFLHRIILNLLSNAIKFTETGSINMEAHFIKQTGQKIEIQIDIRDNGIGIEKKNFKKIFEQFERLSSSYNNVYEGRGLGLYIVKRFVHDMNGTVKVSSKKGKGSCFSVRVPLLIAGKNQQEHTIMENNVMIQSKAILPQKDKSTIDKKGSVNILIVEDTEIARRAVMLALEPLNCSLDIAKTGRDAIKKLSTRSYDLILLDIGLPDISGLEVAQWVRSHENEVSLTPSIIIALTAHLPTSAIQQCLTSGIQQVLFKPLSTARAHALLSNWLGDTYDCNYSNTRAVKEDTDLYQKFIREIPNHEEQLVQAHKNNDLEKVQDIAHIINGAAKILKLISLEKACHSLELLIEDRFTAQEINSSYLDVLEEMQKLRQ